jgi:hypothetical protein
MDDGVEWKDEYAMDWRDLPAKGCTECTPDSARHGRTRIGAFRFTPSAFPYKHSLCILIDCFITDAR